MNQRQLECAVVTARLQSSTKAAAELYTTQPSVAYQISSLEKELGIRLFARDSLGMHLTPEGLKVLPIIEQVLRDMQDALNLARQSQTENHATVSIMHFQHIHDPLFDNAIRIFRERHPDISVRYTMPVISNALEPQDVDIEIVPRFSEGRWPAGMVHAPLFSTRLNAIVPIESPLASLESVTFDDLAGYTVVLLDRPVTEALDAWYIDRVEQMLHSGSLRIDYAGERTLQSIQYYLIGNPQLVFPTQGIHTTLASGLAIIPFSENEPLEQSICWRDAGPNAHATHTFVQFLREHYRNHAHAFAAS